MEQKANPRLSRPQVVEVVEALYQGFLGRKPERTGLRYWVERIESGEGALGLLGDFLLSSEYAARSAGRRELQKLTLEMARIIDGNSAAAPTVIVDVGAQLLDAEDHVYSPLLRHAKSRVIGFEPLAHRLREREDAEVGTGVSMRSAFIGDGGQHTFHINRPDSTSSLLPFNRDAIAELVDLDELKTVSTEQVSTVTLDEAVSDLERIDFLKLDIQGFEYAALANASSVLSRTLVVHCEVEFLQIYEGQPLFSEVDQLLRANGFRFVDFSCLGRYPFKCEHSISARDQLGWGDAIYFKQANLVRSQVGLLVQSFIALAVYGRPSLAAFLLREYDSRAGSSHGLIFGG